jgi:hypothetical protein
MTHLPRVPVLQTMGRVKITNRTLPMYVFIITPTQKFQQKLINQETRKPIRQFMTNFDLQTMHDMIIYVLNNIMFLTYESESSSEMHIKYT